MNYHHKAFSLFVIILILLSGCSATFEEKQKEAFDAVKTSFEKSPAETNKSNEDIQYYLPFGFEIKEETPNNIILKNGSKTYILFYNLQEDAVSEVVLNATLQQKKYDVMEELHGQEKLGFFLVKENNKQSNEVTVGIGGVKITSEVKTKGLKSEAEIMMKIVNSVQYNK